MLTLFYSTGTCSTASRIAFEEAGIPYNGTEVSWMRNVNVDQLNAVNPLGQVPVLVDGDRTLTQGAAILEYIAKLAPNKHLMPEAGSWEYSQALSWLGFISADFHKSFSPMFRAAKWTASEAAQAEIKKAAAEAIDKNLAYIDQALAGKDFILGKQFSVVDAYLFIVTGWCRIVQVKVGKYPNLTAYMKRIYERPSVQKILREEDLLNYIPE